MPYLHCRGKVLGQLVFGIDDLHGASTQHVGGPHHDWEAQLFGGCESFLFGFGTTASGLPEDGWVGRWLAMCCVTKEFGAAKLQPEGQDATKVQLNIRAVMGVESISVAQKYLQRPSTALYVSLQQRNFSSKFRCSSSNYSCV